MSGGFSPPIDAINLRLLTQPSVDTKLNCLVTESETHGFTLYQFLHSCYSGLGLLTQ